MFLLRVLCTVQAIVIIWIRSVVKDVLVSFTDVEVESRDVLKMHQSQIYISVEYYIILFIILSFLML